MCDIYVFFSEYKSVSINVSHLFPRMESPNQCLSYLPASTSTNNSLTIVHL